MQYVTKFKPTQLQMSHLHTLRCFARLIIHNSLKQWRSKYLTTRLVVTGISCCVQTYLLALKQSWPSGHSNERGFPTEHWISIRPDYVPTEVNKLGVKTTGILMLLLLHGPAFDFCSSWPRFMASTLKASILFSHSLRQTWTYQFTWSSLQESTRLMFLMETDADTS